METARHPIRSFSQRSWPRVSTSFKASFSDPQGHFREEEVTNLSKGGLFLKTNDPVHEGERLELMLALPNRPQEVTIFGQVIHSRKPSSLNPVSIQGGMGIMFNTIEPKLKKSLAQFIAALFFQNKAENGDHSKFDSPANRVHLNANLDGNSATLKNITPEGIFIHIEHPLVLFEKVKTNLAHPDTGLDLELEGEVIQVQRIGQNIQKYAAGIKFLGMDRATQEPVQEILREILLRQQLNQRSYLPH
jgi:uncharacterized protein (TIGR02266 family)